MPYSGISKCSYIYCRFKGPGRKFYEFPFSRPGLLKQWVTKVRSKDWVLNKNSLLCSSHFEPSCFELTSHTMRLKHDAVPTIFSSPHHSKKVKKIARESKFAMQAMKFYKNYFGTKEKECNKCGFASFSLHVLYTHKHKCQGQLLGPSMICYHCKRKFDFFSAYKNHKQTCVKLLRKKHSHRIKKMFIKHFNAKQIKSSESSNFGSSYLSSSDSEKKEPRFVVCSTCKLKFQDVRHYKLHLKKGLCHSNQESNIYKHGDTNKKQFISARKSFSKAKHGENYFSKTSVFDPDNSFHDSDSHEAAISRRENILPIIANERKNNFVCLLCKDSYPTLDMLFKHLERNVLCAKAYYFQRESKPQEYRQSARKSVSPVVARKSFPLSSAMTLSHEKLSNTWMKSKAIPFRGSARKSMNRYSPDVIRNQTFFCNFCKRAFQSVTEFQFHKKECHSTSKATYINKCPVCLLDFPDTFNFFQHQKKFNHWGKATKSTCSYCKCPFCDKEFLHVRSRNAHLRNHADRSEDDIETFLRKTTCKICSQIFVTEGVKVQHMKIEHVSQSFKNDWSSENFEDSHDEFTVDGVGAHKHLGYADKLKAVSTVTEAMKQKLKKFPNTCPICTKRYTTTFIRDRHFRTHTMETAAACNYCPARFSRTDHLTRHMQQRHIEYLEFECSKCKERFASKVRVLKHAALVHPDREPKSLVSTRNVKRFVIKQDIQKSRAAIGNDEKARRHGSPMRSNIFYCDICEVSFLKLCGLQRHRQSKLHRDTLTKNLDAVRESLSNLPPSPPPVPENPGKQPEILSCSQCDEDFTNIADFVPHRLSHFSSQSNSAEITETNPYTCEICDKVLDSHQRVQFHLFWHLQSQSTSNENGDAEPNVSSKNDPIIPDRLSGQHVAKKSFNKQGKNSQEVVIGGVKKPLFTCDSCSVGFMTKQHYTAHVRRFCKGRKVQSESDNCDVVDEPKQVDENCDVQNSVPDSKDKPDQRPEMPKRSYAKQPDNSDKCVHCEVCNCLFAGYELFQKHIDDYCNDSFHDDAEADNINRLDVLRSAIELECIAAGCIRCGLPFETLQSIKEHMISHKDEPLSDKSFSPSQNNGILDETHQNNFNYDEKNSPKIFSKVADDLVKENTVSETIPKSSTNEEFIGENVPATAQLLLDDAMPETDDTFPETLNTLRENFSRLLCVLISDEELMQRLGYGEKSIDDVLVTVLEQMGQSPIPVDDANSDLDRLRQNIQILLDLCLKDQVMEIIADGQTSTDNVVIQALKMFDDEERQLQSTPEVNV